MQQVLFYSCFGLVSGKLYCPCIKIVSEEYCISSVALYEIVGPGLEVSEIFINNVVDK